MRLLKICANFILLLIGYSLSLLTYIGFGYSIYLLATKTNTFTTKNLILAFISPFVDSTFSNKNILIGIIGILVTLLAMVLSWAGPVYILWLIRCAIDYPINSLMKKSGHRIIFNLVSFIPGKRRKNKYQNYTQNEQEEAFGYNYEQNTYQYDESNNHENQSTSSGSRSESVIPEVEKAKFTFMLDDLNFTKKELKLIRNKFIKKFHSDNAEENEVYAQKINAAYDVLLPYAKEDPK